ncbi:DUF2971 domain-containing protein [Dyadobacter bucti]|uniref:DUF2971 domain-containing protein n=1 Tax=Dyadobacter bucti TaxID=2572203 RepID=UPI001109F016|nr:DUF2971 domain-containing protein [Dyadobacter bucti]
MIKSILPKKLYKYFRPNDNAIKALSNQYLWHPAPQQLNDPYDSQIGWIGEMALGEDTFFSVLNQNLATNLKICSLSEKNDSLLMWSHYSQDHTGFCVEYDFTDSSWQPFPMELYPVHYSNEILDLKSCQDLRLNIYNIAILASIAKHTDWEYEQEWRSFMWNSIISNEIPSPTPTGIYFGAKSTSQNQHIKHAEEIALTKNITRYRMELAIDRFELRAQALNT